LAFLQAFESFRLIFLEMREDVSAISIRCDESEALRI